MAGIDRSSTFLLILYKMNRWNGSSLRGCEVSIWRMILKANSYNSSLNIDTQMMNNIPGLILGLRPVNERRRYFVTTSLIGWAHAWNQPCIRPCFQSPSSDRWSSVLTVATDICIKLGSSLPENQHVLQATWVNTNGEIFYYAQKLLSQVRIDHSHSFCTM